LQLIFTLTTGPNLDCTVATQQVIWTTDLLSKAVDTHCP